MAQPFPPPPTPVRTCYRHANQPAGVVCQRCDRPICPACMHQASVGFHCPECVKKGGQRVYQGPVALGTQPILTMILIAVNAAVFVVGIAMTGSGAIDGSTQLTVDGGLIAQAFDPSSRQVIGVAQGEWYRLVTAGFLHYGILHIAFNMYALWVLGGLIERTVGRFQLGLVYFVSILGGSLGALIVSPDALTVGASGGIFGLMGAVLALGRSRGISIRNSPVFAILILNLLLTFGLSRYISVGGHLGGLAAGFIAGMLLFELPPRIAQNDRGRTGTLAPGAVVGIVLCALLGAALFVGGIVAASAASVG